MGTYFEFELGKLIIGCASGLMNRHSVGKMMLEPERTMKRKDILDNKLSITDDETEGMLGRTMTKQDASAKLEGGEGQGNSAPQPI